MATKTACIVCKVAGILTVAGALNWGLVGFFGVDLVYRLLGNGMLAKIVYDLIGLSGALLVFSYFKACPACKK